MSTRKVLLIEDDRDIAKLLALHLEDLHCEVTICLEGRDGLNAALSISEWSLIVLDLSLPQVAMRESPCMWCGSCI